MFISYISMPMTQISFCNSILNISKKILSWCFDQFRLLFNFVTYHKFTFLVQNSQFTNVSIKKNVFYYLFSKMKFHLLNELTVQLQCTTVRFNRVFTLFSLYGFQLMPTMFGIEKSEFCLVVFGMCTNFQLLKLLSLRLIVHSVCWNIQHNSHPPTTSSHTKTKNNRMLFVNCERQQFPELCICTISRSFKRWHCVWFTVRVICEYGKKINGTMLFPVVCCWKRMRYDIKKDEEEKEKWSVKWWKYS